MEVSRYQFVFKMNPPVCVIFFLPSFLSPFSPPKKNLKGLDYHKNDISTFMFYKRNTEKKGGIISSSKKSSVL